MTPVAATDYLIPFLREAEGARGRLVRLTTVADTILSRYDYPAPVATLLGELILVAAMLGANLKQEGIFTIQLRGDGPVPLIVVDSAFGGQLRGFADVKPEAKFDKKSYSPAELIGKEGYLAITLDPGEGMQRYQGVVALEGETITDALVNYFTYSQQLDVLFKLTVEQHGGKWLAGGFMLERMPEPTNESSPRSRGELEGGTRATNSAPEKSAALPPPTPPASGGRENDADELWRNESSPRSRGELEGGTRATNSAPEKSAALPPPTPPVNGGRENDADELWRTSIALANTLKPGELLDPLLEGETLLYRLFHEEGVRVWPPQPVKTGCRCSRTRIHDLLLSMPLEDRADMVVDGEISVHCQFCNTMERFTPQDVGLSVS